MASKLEADMLFAIKAVGLPEPEVERRVMPKCCQHAARSHAIAGPAARAIGLSDICNKCHPSRAEHDLSRDFRFDLCWPAQMLAVELDGATWNAGRHTRGAGFQSDAEKRNLAQLLGWRVLTFTRLDVTSGRALSTIEAALKQSAPA